MRHNIGFHRNADKSSRPVKPGVHGGCAAVNRGADYVSTAIELVEKVKKSVFLARNRLTLLCVISGKRAEMDFFDSLIIFWGDPVKVSGDGFVSSQGRQESERILARHCLVFHQLEEIIGKHGDVHENMRCYVKNSQTRSVTSYHLLLGWSWEWANPQPAEQHNAGGILWRSWGLTLKRVETHNIMDVPMHFPRSRLIV